MVGMGLEIAWEIDALHNNSPLANKGYVSKNSSEKLVFWTNRELIEIGFFLWHIKGGNDILTTKLK